jgi:hypothetical protein
MHRYSMDDPAEYLIGAVSQVSITCPKPGEMPLPVRPDPPLRTDGLLAEVGAVVAYERADGSMAMSTWDGEVIQVWAKFDVSPPPQMVYMRQQMIEAAHIHQPRPAGFIKVICFKRKHGQEI